MKQQIIEEFERREEEFGGVDEENTKRIIRDLAAEHGLTYERVKEIMIRHWVYHG